MDNYQALTLMIMYTTLVVTIIALFQNKK
ncbi:putative holin-like toxin [Filifactor alocis]